MRVQGAGPRGGGTGPRGGSKGRGCGSTKHIQEEGDEGANVKITIKSVKTTIRRPCYT